MKKCLVLLPLVFLLFGCVKDHTCSFNYYYNPPGLAFVGFSTPELQQIVIEQYTANTNFQRLVSVDTITEDSLVFQGDTAYVSNSGYSSDGFLTLEFGRDYKIRSLSDAHEFTITEISKPVLSETWTQKGDCSSGSSAPRITTDAVKLNGVSIQPVMRAANNYMYYIQH